MAIQGELQSTDLSSIFQMLALNQTTGLLRVHDRRDFLKSRCLLLDGATLAVAAVTPASGGGLQWVEQGALTLDNWQDLHSKATLRDSSIVFIADTDSALSTEQLAADSRQHQLEAILEVFLWPDVVFSLEEFDSLEEREGRVFFSVDRIVMESARRQDEWARVVDCLANGEHILHANPRLPGEGSESTEDHEAGADLCRGLREFVDGVRGLNEIAAASGLSRYTTGICLASMIGSGELASMTLDDLLITGDRLMREGRAADALRLFLSALRFDRRNFAIHKRLASAYEGTGKIARAGAHFRFCGVLLRRQNKVREAYELTVRAHSLVPTDFRALRMSVELLDQMDTPLTDGDEALLAVGCQLFHFHADAGHLKPARQIGALILRITPDDLALAVEYARILVRSNRKVEAADAYCQIAEGLIAEGNPKGAIGFLRTAIDLDASRSGMCTRKIRLLKQTEDDRSRRRRRGRVALLTAGLCLLFALGYFYHHNAARAALDVVRSEEGNLEGETAWMGQAERYSDLAARYPFTSAGVKAESMEGSARGRALAIREVEWKRQQAETKRVSQRLGRARQNLVTGLGRQAELDLNGALACFVSARDTAIEIGAEDWLKSHEIAKRIADLEAHLSNEGKVLAVLERALGEERFEAAHAAALKLLGREDDDSLDLTDIHVVSRTCRDRIRVPYRLTIVPESAKLRVDGASQSISSAGIILLDRTCSPVTLRSRSSSGQSAALKLNWRDGSHYQLIAVPDEPSTTVVLGQRVVDLVVWRGEVCAVCADGSLRFLDSSQTKPHVLLPRDGLFPLAGSAFIVGDQVVLTGADGSVRCASLLTMEWQWSRAPKGDALRVLALDSTSLIVLESGRLKALDIVDGKELWEFSNPGRVVAGGLAGAYAWVLDAEGCVTILKAGDGVTVKQLDGIYVDVVGLETGRLLCFGETAVQSVAAATGSLIAELDLNYGVQVRAVRSASTVTWLNSAGELVTWDGADSAPPRRIQTSFKGLTTSGKRLGILGDGMLSVVMVGNMGIRFEAGSGKAVSVYEGTSDAVRRIVSPGGDTVYYCSDMNAGVIEVHRYE